MVNSQGTFVQDCFGRTCQLIVRHCGQPLGAGKQIHFFDEVTTETFLKRLRLSRSDWQRLLGDHYRYDPYDPGCIPLEHIADLAIRGHIRIYQLPGITHQPRAHNGQDRAWVFFAGPEVLPHVPYPHEAIRDEAHAAALVASLQPGKGFWGSTFFQANYQQELFDHPTPKALEACAIRYLLNGKLIAYYLPWRPPAPRSRPLEYLDEPIRRYQPPPPAEKNWIDLGYRYADGSGVGGANYCVKDANSGAELASGTLSPEGTAYTTLPLSAAAVTVEYSNDPARNKVLDPTEPATTEAPPGWFERMGEAMESKRESAWDSTGDGLNWAWETLQGDFNETPTSGQIITNAVITMIPVVDQAGDVRDIVANLKLLVWDKRYNEFLVWLALFFTLIGLIPVLGSALKGILKLVWKGARLDELLKVFNWFMKGNGVRWLKELQGGKLKQYSKEAADIGHQVFDAIISKLNSYKRYIPKAMTKAHKELNDVLETLSTVKGKINGMFEQIAGELNEKLGKILDEAEPQIGQSSAKANYTKQQTRQKPPEEAVHDGLHNQDMEVEVTRGSFKTIRQVDINNLSEADELAAITMREQGWKPEKIQEVLSSGNNFYTKEIKAGDRLYGFDTRGRSKDIGTSAYWVDEAAFNELQKQQFKDGVWDKEGIKNSLALPCYNRANSISVVEVTENTTAVQSTVGKATELIKYTDNSSYDTGVLGKIMPGGGTQTTVKPSTLQLSGK